MQSPKARSTEQHGVVRVLVVDPSAQSRSVLKGSLRTLDLVEAVMERSTTSDLLQILAETPVHLVMMEQDLGTDDPIMIAQQVRAHPNIDKPAFVLMGRALAPELRARAIAAGFKGFLAKPFDLRALENTIRDALNLRSGAPEAGAAPGAREPAVNREILERLRKVYLFSAFTDQDLLRLLRICALRQFIANQYVFREGEPGKSMFVLISGQIEIRLTRDGAERTLNKMNPGDCFGEMAILDAAPRSADAYCLSPCMMIEVKAETIHKDDDPIALKLVRQIAILLAQKIRKLSQ
jgi:CRP/FNR family cyclic AMP-dependent transcriptional regulator